MADMLVRLYDLPDVSEAVAALAEEGIVIRRPQPWELTALRGFIKNHFSEGWADETTVGFANKPISVFIAQEGSRIVGFAAYECTRRNFFGPMGVDEAYRKRGVGGLLTVACLEAMARMGYGYAIIGSAGPKDFYHKCCGAEVIENSEPGIYCYERVKHPPEDGD
jgi:ribosomal protein S18 acetylase RimI-like enzyme